MALCSRCLFRLGPDTCRLVWRNSLGAMVGPKAGFARVLGRCDRGSRRFGYAPENLIYIAMSAAAAISTPYGTLPVWRISSRRAAAGQT